MLHAGSRSLQILCPSHWDATGIGVTKSGTESYTRYLDQIQRLRGRCYVDDGAIPASALDATGRHIQPEDLTAWHVLLMDDTGVIGCVRMSFYAPELCSLDSFGLRHASIASDPEWGPRIRRSIDSDLRMLAARNQYAAELGGWAIAQDHRDSRAAMYLLTGCCALGRAHGDCICYGTATRRHGSLDILRRLGGCPLYDGTDVIPDYFDPRYGCEMGFVRFASMWTRVRIERYIREITSQFELFPTLLAA